MHERSRFHSAYRLAISRPPVDWIDVITPFHRVALAAEAKARLGRPRIRPARGVSRAQRGAESDRVAVRVDLPSTEQLCRRPGVHGARCIAVQDKAIAAQFITRYPRFGPRTETNAPAPPNPNAAPILGSGQPMLGGTMVVQFATDAIDANGRYDIVMADGGKEILRTGVDFGRMR